MDRDLDACVFLGLGGKGKATAVAITASGPLPNRCAISVPWKAFSPLRRLSLIDGIVLLIPLILLRESGNSA